jgi:ribosomal protein S18 acetylase RimI-like enzyme
VAATGRQITVRYSSSVEEVDVLEPLWGALQDHHAEVDPILAGKAPKRDAGDAWRMRRSKYERWLGDPEAFFVLAEDEGRPVGYAFVTVGPGYASWRTGELLAELETLSVLPEHRGGGVGEMLLEAVWSRLADLGVEDLAVTTVSTNVDARRFYERQGFGESFVVYYAKAKPRSRLS